MKILRICIGFFLAFCVVFTAIFGIEKIKTAGEIKGSQNSGEKTIITVWQIDSFEGGINSRRRFLENVAKSFERKNSGVLFLVLGYTEEGARENFSKGIFPDLISYGNGVYIEKAIELTGVKSFKGGMIGDKTFGAVWARGGYVLIENKNYEKREEVEEIAISSQTYTQPLIALLEEGITDKKINVLKPLDAYVRFVSGKCKYLLGTQRDIHRLENKNINYEANPIQKYNDLYQYISVTSTVDFKKEKCKEFISFLTSLEIQKQLNGIGMMSNDFKVEYENSAINKMQEISGEFSTISVFTGREILLNLKDLAKSAFYGNEKNKNKIKNILI